MSLIPATDDVIDSAGEKRSASDGAGVIGGISTGAGTAFFAFIPAFISCLCFCLSLTLSINLGGSGFSSATRNLTGDITGSVLTGSDAYVSRYRGKKICFETYSRSTLS